MAQSDHHGVFSLDGSRASLVMQGDGHGLTCGPRCWDAFLEFSSQETAFWRGHRAPTPLCWPSGTPLHRPQKPRETEDAGPVAAFQQAPFSEPPPPGYVLPEPGFPDADPSQVGAWPAGMWRWAQVTQAGPGWG